MMRTQKTFYLDDKQSKNFKNNCNDIDSNMSRELRKFVKFFNENPDKRDAMFS